MLDLAPPYLQIILQLIQQHLPHIEVWAFGSRVTWTAKDYSDLDLVLKAPQPLPPRRFFQFQEAIETSDLPIQVDVLDWHQLSTEFRKNIKQHYEVIYPVKPQERSSGGKFDLYSLKHHPSWTEYCLYDLADWINGLAFRNINFTNNGLPVIKIAELKNGLSAQTKYTDGIYDEKYRLSKGDLLFSWSGSPETSIDAFWFEHECGWLNQHIFKVVAKEIVITEYLFYLLKYAKPNFIDIAKNKQTTGLGHVTGADLKRFKVSVPSMEEQIRIVSYLKPIDDKIALNRQMNETLEEMAQAIFKSWLVDFDPVHAKQNGQAPIGMDTKTAALFPDAFEDSELGEIPRGWGVISFPELFHINLSRNLKKGMEATYLDMKNMPMRGHRPNQWIKREYKGGSKFMNGDTLVARITPCLENGKTAFVDFLEDEEVGYGSTEYIVLRPKANLPNVFGYFVGRSESFRDFAIRNMSGTSGRQRVSADDLKYYQMVCPPKEIISKFGEIVHPLFQFIARQDNESRTLTSIRDALLPKLLSGEIQVRGVENEIARSLTEKKSSENTT